MSAPLSSYFDSTIGGKFTRNVQKRYSKATLELSAGRLLLHCALMTGENNVLLHTEQLVKIYGGRRVVNGVDINVKAGAHFSVQYCQQAGLKETNLDFSHVEGPKVADTFAKLGYKPLIENTRFLTGEQTRRGNVILALEGLKDLAPPATVLVYYSGHGVTSEQEHNLWLQLSGQEKVGPGHGVTLREVVKTPRMAGYNGELIVIVDASYSGQPILSEALKLTRNGPACRMVSCQALALMACGRDIVSMSELQALRV